ncbi:MAG: nicotinate-nucleotide--dimethylbenzimidazole phosphoribosyltransferase [Candidatus Avoscillospira sp.]
MTLQDVISAIAPADRDAMAAAQKKWDAVGKPLGSLGILEDMVVRMAGVFGTKDFSIEKKAVAIMCADNGVVAEGVSQSGQEVTAIVAENMAKRQSSVCKMARVAGAEIYPVDVGMANPVDHPGLVQRCVRRGGTRNFVKEPAMTRAETEQAILVGVESVRVLCDRGVRLIATGEMGIGNTTTSAAVLSVLLNRSPAEMTGRGAGLSNAGLERKIQAIETGIALHHPDPSDAVDVLSKVGGFDLAGLCGVFLGGALYHVPVLIDGLISAASALAAATLCPAAKDYMLASHLSGEPAGWPVLNALEVRPVIQAGMRLGEGTGAVAVMPILDMTMTVYDGNTFDDLNMEAYMPQS